MSTGTYLRDIKQYLIPFAILGTLMSTFNSYAIDVDAGDYEPAAPGTNIALLYLQNAQRDSLYGSGNELGGSNRLDSNIGIFRYVHFTEINGMVVDPQFLIPFGRLEGKDDTAGLGRANGIGDPIIAATFWVQNDVENHQFTGITPYLYIPIGSYDNNDPLTLGENRWKFNLQAAHVRKLSENISMDLVGDVMLFGENDDFTSAGLSLKQKPLFQGQAWLRYHLSTTSDVRFLVSHSLGGQTEVEGIDQDTRTSTTKIALGGSFFVGGNTQLLAMVGRDLSVENGFKENFRFNLRFLYII
jgi:hypothetical protein